MIDLLTDNLTPEKIQENFQKLREFISKNPVLSGNFKFYEVTVTNASANYPIYHRLGFEPKDVIITYVSTGTASPVYSSFTKEKIELNVSTACSIRLLIGSMSLRGQ